MFSDHLFMQTQHLLCFLIILYIYDSLIQSYQTPCSFLCVMCVFSSYFRPSVLLGDTGLFSMFLFWTSSIRGRTFDTGGLTMWGPWSFPCTLANGGTPLQRHNIIYIPDIASYFQSLGTGQTHLSSY